MPATGEPTAGAQGEVAAPFGRVTILGGGLLGGSLALRLAATGGAVRPVLWARRPATVAQALAFGISSATTDLAAAVQGCELLVLATPVGVMAGLLARAVAAGLPGDAVVTDVGSVKRMPAEQLPRVAGGRVFVGSHPMAGSQQAGIDAARGDLFAGAACIVTGPGPAAARVAAFWRHVGCRVLTLGAAEHDHAVARISHLPHVLAAVCARVGLADPLLGAMAGGGLRDTSRVAGGDPAMWAEILLENRDAMAGPLRESIELLREILALLEAGGEEPLRAWLARAKELRDGLEP